MAHLLLCSSPIWGHVAPMLQVGADLVARGHRVSLLTGAKYRARVEEAGMRFLPLPTECDYDDANLDAWLPGRAGKKGLAAVRYDITGMFVRVIPGQHRALTAALDADAYDAILCEGVFTGVLPLLLSTPRGNRPPVIGISALPLTARSVDTAPYGPGMAPGSGPLARVRNRLLNAMIYGGALKPITDAANERLYVCGSRPLDGTIFDMVRLFDHTFELGAAGLEYPRRELAGHVEFVGPLGLPAAASTALPEWWADLRGSRPVVHVTQGTIDNADLSRVLAPTLRGLAGEDVLVVASTGGRPVDEVTRLLGGTLPGNARVAEFLPYDQLLPLTDVVVTNGGFGGVQQAVAHGVPLVVAGTTEDKPEVAARVAWSGTGLSLRTGTPTPEKVRKAVLRVLADDRYRAAAAGIAREVEALGDPLERIVAALPTRETRRSDAAGR
ncbi:glycosyltransferase [Leifsonia sp. F6_8S_P_1B]|uniref:Glycosyltransferase n=1 Tax=Leifsonia williamsii TaxID=3035919 RepID=A0ABT8K634_9MICO|nr:nucleotide disphospho-sugar-binding domain-containing protein [Leifsonia williamsii]MDN4612923.1 glycosyltransferase [Leifsonia williamsii]